MVDVGRDIVENEPIPSLVGRHSRAIGGALEPTLGPWCAAVVFGDVGARGGAIVVLQRAGKGQAHKRWENRHVKATLGLVGEVVGCNRSSAECTGRLTQATAAILSDAAFRHEHREEERHCHCFASMPRTMRAGAWAWACRGVEVPASCEHLLFIQQARCTFGVIAG